MGKDPNQCLSDIVEGMLPDIRREVILGCPQNISDMTKKAKLAEIVCEKSRSRSDRSSETKGETEHTKHEISTLIEELKKVAKYTAEGSNSDKSGHDNVQQFNAPGNQPNNNSNNRRQNNNNFRRRNGNNFN